MVSRSATVVDFRPRDADRTQQEILRAAMGEFAGHGFGGARIEAIAERAGVNKKLIYYYFEGKDELFLAVLEQTYTDIRAAEHELHLEASAPLRAIESLVEFTWRHYLAHPEFLA
jgi:AcrR family transcriptional regulator